MLKPVIEKDKGNPERLHYYCICGRYMGFTNKAKGIRELRKEENCRRCGIKLDWEEVGITDIHIKPVSSYHGST